MDLSYLFELSTVVDNVVCKSWKRRFVDQRVNELIGVDNGCFVARGARGT